MPGLQGIALHALPAGFGVASVEIDAMPARDERERLIQVCSQFIGIARLARVMARHRQTAAQLSLRGFEAGDVVPLPAVQRERDFAQLPHRVLGIHPEFRIAIASKHISPFDRRGFAAGGRGERGGHGRVVAAFNAEGRSNV